MWWNNRPGIELFSRGATPKVSSPLQRFTIPSSGWIRCGAIAPTTPGLDENHPQDCTAIKFKLVVFCSMRSSPRSVSTPRLHTLLHFHLAPINRCSACDLTYLCSESTHLEVGFPLRCFQRLSAPHLATQRLPLAR